MNLHSTALDVSLAIATRVDPNAARRLAQLLFASIDLTELDGIDMTSTASHMMNPATSLPGTTGILEGMST
jgi:hypothetical protein